MEVVAHPALPLVCRDLAELARAQFERSDRAMAACARRVMRPATLMREMYRAVFRLHEAEGFVPRDPPVKVPAAIKLWCVLRHGLI
jgi:phytoene synthase